MIIPGNGVMCTKTTIDFLIHRKMLLLNQKEKGILHFFDALKVIRL